MLVTSLVSDYLSKTSHSIHHINNNIHNNNNNINNNNNNNNNNTMVQSVDVPIFYHNNRGNNMADELLSLKWNNHKSTFANVLSVLRDQEVFVDVTLACGGKLYPAHKFVLSTCSDYFREMFTKNPCKHPIVYMKDVSGRDLEALLDFMYRGEVNVPQTDLASLIKTAEGLQVKGLAVPDEQQLNPPFIRRNRELSTPRPPPAPSVSPTPKRKRMKEENYTPVGALSMMYTSMSPQEPNSPYDLSQKSSSSSSVSQSDAIHNDRIHSMSPDQPPHQMPHQTQQASATSSISSYHNKESSPGHIRNSRTPDDAPQRNSRSPPPPSSTPHPAPSITEDMKCRDCSRENLDPLPGPSGMQCKGEEEDEEEPMIKEDLSMEEDDENEWAMGNGGCSDGGDTTSGGESIHHECIPHHYNEASNSSLPTLDPALSSTKPSSTKAQQQQQQQLFDSTTALYDQSTSQFESNPSLLDPSATTAQFDPNNCLQCPICLKEFKVLGSLKRHYRSHINFKPFVCDLCGKRFTLNQYLIEHRRTHTGERPYKCHVCGKSFAQTGTLYHHVKNVHHISWVADKNEKTQEKNS